MRGLFYFVLAVCVIGVAFHLLQPTPPVEAVATPAPTPAPEPAFVPNAATGAILAISKMYPDVTKAGTPFNLMFVEQVKTMRANRAQEMLQPDWPFQVAQGVASHLGVEALALNPTPTPTPIPTPTPLPRVVAATPAYENPLERGAYDHYQSVTHGAATYATPPGRWEIIGGRSVWVTN